MHLARTLTLLFPIALFTSYLSSACSSSEPTATLQNPRVTWDFGVVGAAGGEGQGGMGQGGSGEAGDELLSLSRFKDADDAFKKFMRDCEPFDGKNYNYFRYASLPYHSSLYECFVASQVCPTANEFLCGDFPDEWNDCFAANNDFKCNNGDIIPAEYQCDTLPDCKEAEDELGCQDLWYQCDDGSPIVASQHCDSQVQCPDGSDEDKCSITYFSCDFSKGIPDWKVCNGVTDCTDGSDEKQTCVHASCD